jgi:hypothetical protein
MKTSVFKDAVNKICKIPAGAGVPSSEFISLNPTETGAELFLAYNLQGKVTVPGKGRPGDIIAVDRKALQAFLSNCPTDEAAQVKVSTSDSVILLTAASRRAEIQTPASFKPWIGSPAEEKFTKIIYGAEDTAKISLAAECASQDTTRPEISCVYVDVEGVKKTAYAYNQIGVFAARLNSNDAHETIALPLPICRMMSGKETILIGNAEAGIVDSDSQFWMPAYAKATTSFPIERARALWDAPRHCVATIHDVLGFSNAMQNILSCGGNWISEIWAVKMEAIEGETKLKLSVQVTGARFEEEVQLDEPCKASLLSELPMREYSKLTKTFENKPLITISKDARNAVFLELEDTLLVMPSAKK